METLILGSFPSAASLAHRQYYAHPRNQFWRLLGDVLGEPLAGLPYASRLQRLKFEDARLADWSALLLDQAILAEGGMLADPASFVRRMNDLLLGK